METEGIRERKHNATDPVSDENIPSTPLTPEDSDNDESYTISRSLSGRINDFVYSLFGNGYELFSKPHTASWIILFFAVVVYYTCFVNKPVSILDSIRCGIVLICLFIVVFAANQFREGPLNRPHPMVWKAVLAIAVLYECLLLFILSLSPDQARQFMRFFDASLGEPLIYRDYAADCRMYIPENPDHFKNLREVFIEIFFLAHFLGWIWKAFVFRDWKVLWVISIWFECLEVSAQHILPNFQECWWDKMVADVFGANLLGMCIGMWINKKMAAREYSWVDFPDIPTKRGKAHRLITQFSPHSWKVYDWDIFGSFKSFSQTAFLVVIFETAEMNAFFLKSSLWIPPSHPLVVVRLFIWGFLSLPAVREAYDFFHDPKNKRLGQNFWTAICMTVTELLIDYKMGEGILYGDNIPHFPPTIKWCWIIFLSLIGLWIVLYLTCGGGHQVSKHPTSSDKKWGFISNFIVYSIPLPMLYILFWDFFLKPHIEFDSFVV